MHFLVLLFFTIRRHLPGELLPLSNISGQISQCFNSGISNTGTSDTLKLCLSIPQCMMGEICFLEIIEANTFDMFSSVEYIPAYCSNDQ